MGAKPEDATKGDCQSLVNSLEPVQKTAVPQLLTTKKQFQRCCVVLRSGAVVREDENSSRIGSGRAGTF